MAPQAPRAVRAPVTFKKQKDHHSGLCDLQSPISNLQSPASTHLRPDPVRSPSSISNLQSPASYFAGSSLDLRSPSPISNLQSRFGGPGEGGGSSLQGDALWIHSHRTSPMDLRSPISHLTPAAPPAAISNLQSRSPISAPAVDARREDLRSVFSISNLHL